MTTNITYKAEPDMGRGWRVVAYGDDTTPYVVVDGLTVQRAEFEAANMNAANGVSS